MKLTWLAGLLALALPAVAQAHWYGGWGFRFGFGVAPVYSYPAYAPPVAYYAPPPRVVYSAPAYVAPAPVYVAPAPVYAPPPVVYAPGYYYPSVYVGFGARYPHYYHAHYYYRH
ncbi:MAG TPA: hypothetical protein VGI81_10230 [Tepidisphaeraceae bacterium]|jgi:hypothetical protein